MIHRKKTAQQRKFAIKIAMQDFSADLLPVFDKIDNCRTTNFYRSRNIFGALFTRKSGHLATVVLTG
jgi:Xaa-Pro aminopeptidase